MNMQNRKLLHKNILQIFTFGGREKTVNYRGKELSFAIILIRKFNKEQFNMININVENLGILLTFNKLLNFSC